MILLRNSLSLIDNTNAVTFVYWESQVSDPLTQLKIHEYRKYLELQQSQIFQFPRHTEDLN